MHLYLMKTQLHAPLLGLGVFFALGISLENFFPQLGFQSLTILLLLVCCALLSRKDMLGPREEMYKSLMILFVFVLLGYARAKLGRFEYYSHSLQTVECKESWMRGKLTAELKQTKFGYQSELQLEVIQFDSIWHRVGGKIQLHFKDITSVLINH